MDNKENTVKTKNFWVDASYLKLSHSLFLGVFQRECRRLHVSIGLRKNLRGCLRQTYNTLQFNGS